MSHSMPEQDNPVRAADAQQADACGSQTMHWHAPAKPAAAPEAQRWPVEAVQSLLDMPFLDLLHRAQSVHRENWRARSSWRPCCPSRPAAAPRTAATARSRPSSTRA
jgi:biotin synthase